MATDEAGRDSLDEQAYLVVAALADGEPVDPDALKLALEQSAVRDYLVDLMALRRTVADIARPGAGRMFRAAIPAEQAVTTREKPRGSAEVRAG